MNDHNDLGSFLRNRRERADPAQAGVVDHVRRRVSGLRREELAMLSGVSATYYARLEQGRDRNPSAEVLDALARVLRLDQTESTHLRRLAGIADPRPTPVTEAVRPGVRHLIEQWSQTPAFVVNLRRDVLIATELASSINPGWTAGVNLAEFAFLDQRAKSVYAEWDLITAQTVAGLRATAVADPTGSVHDFITSLARRSSAFAELWDAQDVDSRTIGQKRFRLDGFGILELTFETFEITASPGQTLFIYTAESGSPSEAILARLRRKGS